jgi:hypothetical protein
MAAVDKKSDRLFKEDRRSAKNAQGYTTALCAHGKPKAVSCHEGECDRDASAAKKKSVVNQKIQRGLGTDNGTNNQKIKRGLGTDNATNNAKIRIGLGTDNGTNNKKARRALGTDNGTINNKARAEEKKLQAIKANHIDISESEIADTMSDYYAHGGRKPGATKKGQSTFLLSFFAAGALIFVAEQANQQTHSRCSNPRRPS